MANTPTNPGYYPSAPAQQQVVYQQVPVQMQQGHGHAQQQSAAELDMARRMEQMETQRKLDALTHANEMLQLKMENQRDAQLRDKIHTQSTIMAMSAATSKNNAPAAAPIVIQGPTINNVSTNHGYGAPAAGGGYGAPPRQQDIVHVVQVMPPQKAKPVVKKKKFWSTCRGKLTIAAAMFCCIFVIFVIVLIAADTDDTDDTDGWDDGNNGW